MINIEHLAQSIARVALLEHIQAHRGWELNSGTLRMSNPRNSMARECPVRHAGYAESNVQAIALWPAAADAADWLVSPEYESSFREAMLAAAGLIR